MPDPTADELISAALTGLLGRANGSIPRGYTVSDGAGGTRTVQHLTPGEIKNILDLARGLKLSSSPPMRTYAEFAEL